MVEKNSGTDLFKFLVVRDRPTGKTPSNVVVVGDVPSMQAAVPPAQAMPLAKTKLRENIDALVEQPEEQRQQSAAYIESRREQYEGVRAALAPVFNSLWRADEVGLDEVLNAIGQVVDGTRDIIDEGSDEERSTAIGHLLQDMILAWSLQPPERAHELDEAIRFLRFWYLGVTASAQVLLPAMLEDALDRVVVVLPETVSRALAGEMPTPTDEEEDEAANGGAEDSSAEITRLETEIRLVTESLATLREGIRSGNAMRTHEERTQRPEPAQAAIRGPSEEATPDRMTVERVSNVVQQHLDISLMPQTTQDVLQRFVGPLEHASERDVLDRISAQIGRRQARIHQLRRQDRQWIVVGNMLVKKLVERPILPSNIALQELKLPTSDLARHRHTTSGGLYYAGVADLKIVKEQLVAYELADIAHVENVLAGEEKERTHRRLEATETEEVVLAELEEETERDTQSTTKNELATESSTVAKEAVHVEGNVTVSGSYGGMVEFSAVVGGGYSSETTNSEKRSAAFAQEVIQRTVEKVRSRVMEQRRVRTLNEIEETNLHAVRNAYHGAEHVRGVYRWLNKISEAQVYNYGARHMFSFVVPEPASFYIWSLGNHGTAELTEPIPPYFNAGDFTRHTYEWFAAEYGASGIKAPPDPNLTVSKSFKSAAAVHMATNAVYTWDKIFSEHIADVIAIPDGYKATWFRYHLDYRWEPGSGIDPGRSVHIGGYDNPGDSMGFHSGEISVGAELRDVLGYLFIVNLHCVIDEDSEKYREWQSNTFESIIEGYRRQVSEYEEKLAAAALQEGIAIPGRNPLENEEIIRNELKRACLSMALSNDLDAVNAFRSTNPMSPDYWKINYSTAQLLGLQTAFMERAFEWENMTYMFYPYFYGRFGEWSRRVIELGDPDHNMAAFLRAGAARVLVPARPEFAEALLQFAQFGNVPSGVESLLTAGDAIVAMIEEVRARGVDSVPNAEPEGEPWEVRLPTSLVLLQDPQEVTFRDALYGDKAGETAVTFDYQDLPVEGNGRGPASIQEVNPAPKVP